MTVVPGHNIIIQQSGVAQELSHQAHAPKPSPEQLAAQQEANIRVENTTVQGFDASEKLKPGKKRDALKKRQAEQAKKKKQQPETDKDTDATDPDPGATGRLLDTTA